MHLVSYTPYADYLTVLLLYSLVGLLALVLWYQHLRTVANDSNAMLVIAELHCTMRGFFVSLLLVETWPLWYLLPKIVLMLFPHIASSFTTQASNMGQPNAK